jgi:hypothetical protein
MSEYEYLTLLSTLREEATIQIQFFMAVFSAYILVIYFSGKQLSLTFLSLLSITYSCFIISPIIAYHTTASNLTAVAARYALDYPEAMVEHVLVDNIANTTAALFILCWVLSVLFMISHRKSTARVV